SDDVDLVGSSLGDSPKESGSSLGTRREIAGKKTGRLVARLSEVVGVCGRRELRVINLVSLVSSMEKEFLAEKIGENATAVLCFSRRSSGRERLWRRGRDCRRNSREGEKDRSLKEVEEKPIKNHDLLLRQKKQRVICFYRTTEEGKKRMVH
ncbi:hypothetical protein BHE74_00051449, partial [Ensete ventricosum]